MAQQSGSSQKNVPGVKGLQIDSVLQDDLTNTSNSVGLVEPSLVERLSGKNRDTSKKPNKKPSFTTEKFTKNRAATNKTVLSKTKKQTKLDSYLIGDKTLNKEDAILSAGQWQPSRTSTVKSLVQKIASITATKSPAGAKTTKNGEWKPNVVSKRVKRINKKIKIEGQRKMTDFLLVCEGPLALEETPIKSITLEKTESIEVNKQIEIVSSEDLATESTVETNNHEEAPSTCNLRSSRTHEEPASRSVSDFSIENIDWYHKNQDYYRGKCKEVFSDFAIAENRLSEMNIKLSYTYLLLDSRLFKNKENISWLDFIGAIFYIGKGTGQRAYKHAKDTEKWLSDDKKVIDKRRHKKYLRIKKIWDNGYPIKVLLVKENIIKEEAFTREAAMIDAMGMRRLCNLISGSYYGVAETMKARQRKELGATLLIEAMEIFKSKYVFDVYPMKIKLDIVKSETLNVVCDNYDPEDDD